MASNVTNRYTSFTITQAFLGAPLQFEPALGSKELEQLIDCYVTGSASKQNKLSEITIDFYNHATVDLLTGSLTKTYTVLTPQWSANAFDQSPNSQSSGYSPVFTTSPASAANMGDSGYGSFSMSSPAANNRGRVSKKAKKDTRKETELRLPGFSIMTKDGIDVTSSAGRGTKTKEQREHAHLMRIMKACPDCKRKKIRCDPSHRRASEMSRTSTSTQSSSSSHPNPSPPSRVPSLTPQTSYTSGSTPSFSPSNAIDDFVLFPEDSWNTDLSLSGLETQDLGQFNFDLNDLNQFPPTNDPTFDFALDSQLSNFQFNNNNLGHTPLLADQYGLEQWDSSFANSMPVHTRPHPSAASGDTGGLDSSFQASWLHDVSDVSPMTNDHANNFFANGPQRQSQPFHDDSPSSLVFGWSELDGSIPGSPAAPQINTPGSSQSSGSSELRTRKRRASSDADGSSYSLSLANDPGSGSGIDVDPSDVPKPRGLQMARSGTTQLRSQSISSGQLTLPRDPAAQIASFTETSRTCSNALQSISSASPEAASLAGELERLQSVFQLVQSQHAQVSGSIQRQISSLATRLRLVTTQAEPCQISATQSSRNDLESELRPDYLRECQIQARRLVRSLCATINNVATHHYDTVSSVDGPMLTSGRNVHLFAPSDATTTTTATTTLLHTTPASLDAGVRGWVESTHQWQLGNTGNSSRSIGTSIESTGSAPYASGQSHAANIAANVGGRAGYRSLSAPSLEDAYSLAANGSLTGDSGIIRHQQQPSTHGHNIRTDQSSLPFGVGYAQSGLQVPGFNSFAAESLSEIIASNDTIDNVKSRDSIASSHAGNRFVKDQSAENSLPSAHLQVSQSLQTNAAATSVAQHAIQASLVSQPSVASIASVQILSSTASQMVLPLLATLFASYVASSNGVTMSLSPFFQYLFTSFALSFFLPTSTSMSKSLLSFSSMIIAALTAAPIIDILRQAASQWIGSDPIVAVVKLTLIAVLTAQLPHFFSQSNLGLAVVTFMSTFHSNSCQSFSPLVINQEDSCAQGTGRGGRSGNVRAWLAAMVELSPVVVL